MPQAADATGKADPRRRVSSSGGGGGSAAARSAAVRACAAGRCSKEITGDRGSSRELARDDILRSAIEAARAAHPSEPPDSCWLRESGSVADSWEPKRAIDPDLVREFEQAEAREMESRGVEHAAPRVEPAGRKKRVRVSKGASSKAASTRARLFGGPTHVGQLAVDAVGRAEVEHDGDRHQDVVEHDVLEHVPVERGVERA